MTEQVSCPVPVDIMHFLMGTSPLEGVYFGDPHPDRAGKFWWRNVINERLASVPYSAPPTLEDAVEQIARTMCEDLAGDPDKELPDGTRLWESYAYTANKVAALKAQPADPREEMMDCYQFGTVEYRMDGEEHDAVHSALMRSADDVRPMRQPADDQEVVRLLREAADEIEARYATNGLRWWGLARDYDKGIAAAVSHLRQLAVIRSNVSMGEVK